MGIICGPDSTGRGFDARNGITCGGSLWVVLVLCQRTIGFHLGGFFYCWGLFREGSIPERAGGPGPAVRCIFAACGGTHVIDSVPISSIVGMWFVDLWNPKYTAHIFKVTVAMDMSGNIVWICLFPPADVLIWEGYGLSHT